MYRLIALDIDGTLIGPEGRVSAENRAAIREARQAGATVVLATGRSWQEAAEIAAEAGCDTPIVCLGGAGLADLGEKRLLEHWPIPEECARNLLERLQREDLGVLAFGGDRLVINDSCEELFRGYPCPAFHRERILAKDVAEYVRAHHLEVDKIFALGHPERFPVLRRAAEAGGAVYVTSSAPDNLEILRRGVDKGSALAALAGRLGVRMEEVLCIGDSDNDRGMLAVAGMPVVMGNAAPEIRALGRYITDTNRNDGVAKAIRHFLRG